MPTVHIFGQEIERKTLFIGGGLIAAAVAVVVWLRARSASSAAAAADQSAAQPDQGAGMSIAAPSGGVADQYQQQLDNAQLQAQTIANSYQQQLMIQQEKQFEFQQRQQEALAPAYQAEQQAQLSVQTHFEQAAAKAPVSCPGSASVRTDPATGQLYCRQKTSGGFLGIPVGDIFRTVQNFVGGVEAAAPSLGYQAAQNAATYYTGKVFGPSGPTGNRPVQQVRINQPQGTPPFYPTPTGLPVGTQQMSGGSMGYGDHIG